jgi:hypothetical protein
MRHTRPPSLAYHTSAPPHTTLALFPLAKYGRRATADTSATPGRLRNLPPTMPPETSLQLVSKIKQAAVRPCYLPL